MWGTSSRFCGVTVQVDATRNGNPVVRRAARIIPANSARKGISSASRPARA